MTAAPPISIGHSYPALGARITPQGVSYTVWAPQHERVIAQVGHPGGPRRAVPLTKGEDGYFQGVDGEGKAGDLYLYEVDGVELPDPVSRFQPEELLGVSQVIDAGAYTWQNTGWQRPAWGNQMIYELHIGTFTPEGTFRAAIDYLPHVAKLGVNTIEIMPIASFEGSRNWGYDGTLLYAPTKHYGTPDDLRALVDAAHGYGLAVLLDVVYNHLGTPSDYLAKYAAGYFHEGRDSGWGAAFKWDGEGSGPVRHFFIHNALHWLEEYRFDGLRLDATHAIIDESPRHLVAEIAEVCQALGAMVIAEDDRNDASVINDRERGGWGCNAVWADDFHYSVRTSITSEGDFYYGSYRGTIVELVETLSRGWCYDGQYDPRREKMRGTRADNLPFNRFQFCISNHDQTGNRVLGDRLHHIVEPAAYRAVSMLLCLVPQTPLIFMGQEWGTSAPFPFFTDYSGDRNEKIVGWRKEELVRNGVKEDSPMFAVMPNPQDPDTFMRAKLKWEELPETPCRDFLALYQAALEWRRKRPSVGRDWVRIEQLVQTVAGLRWDFTEESWLLLFTLRGAAFNLQEEPFTTTASNQHWKQVLSCNEARFGGANEALFDKETQRLEMHGPECILLIAKKS